MPLLTRAGAAGREAENAWEQARATVDEVREARRSGWMGVGLFDTCANPGCRSGWLHLWRSHSVPVFEDGWTCSPECTRAAVAAAIARELDGRAGTPRAHRHRIPLGLVMLEQGWISRAALRGALEAQKAAGSGRLGDWLIRQGATSEETVTRALGLQWSCPVLAVEQGEIPALAWTLPQLFVASLGVLPLRLAGEKVLYLGFEQSLDPVLALALERMNGVRVESGMVPESVFGPAQARLLEAQFAPVERVEAVSADAAAYAMARAIERARPEAARLVRVHDCLWLRMGRRAPLGLAAAAGQVQDVVCTIGRVDSAS